MTNEPKEVKIVVCPVCGTDLRNVPRRNFAICPNQQCRSQITYPRIEPRDRAEAKRTVLPLASRLQCFETWWKIDGQPGIYRNCLGHADAIRCRYQVQHGVSIGKTSVGWFERASKIESELRDALAENAGGDLKNLT
jgi:hypothetical protein